MRHLTGKNIFHAVVYIFAAIGFVLVVGYFAIRFGLTNQKGIIDVQREAFLGNASSTATDVAYQGPWPTSPEWQIMEEATRRDAAVITHAAHDSGVPARIIVANLVAEQLRLFFTDREALALLKEFGIPFKTR